MPISQFSQGLQNAVAFLPGTYGTALLRRHALTGTFEELSNLGFPPEAIKGLADSVDCNIYFFGNSVPQWGMYLIVASTVAALIIAYVLLNKFIGAKARKK